MKAIVINEFGGPNTLSFQEMTKPQPQAHQVLIQVQAAGVNYADVMQRAGQYPFPIAFPAIVGQEVEGIVEAFGSEVSGWEVGQRVVAFTQDNLGGYAEHALANVADVFALPTSLPQGHATALLVQGLTAQKLLNHRPFASVIITAAAGGVGSMATQIARIKGATTVVALVGSDEKQQKAEQNGATHAINYRHADWADQLTKVLPEGADLVLDSVGGETGTTLVGHTAMGSSYLSYGMASGQPASIASFQLITRQIEARGVVLFYSTPDQRQAWFQELIQWVEAGKLTLDVQAYPLEDALQAHQAIEARQTTGKMVLTTQHN